ncbi:MAG: GNAT family N-acetyltransferase [Candidatus Zixiibacteriota bacterium]
MNTEIRRLSIADYDDVIKLWSLAGLPHRPRGRDSRQKFSEELQLPVVGLFGLFHNSELLAVGLANYDGRRGWVNRVAVHPDYRGKRLAGEIIRECEQFLRSRGAVVICALIEEHNLPSMAAFSKAGYICHNDIKYFSKRESPDA